MESTTEIKRLQSCINDLVSVLALPAIWSGSESSQILGTLLDVLLTMLRLDFAYARMSASDGPPIEIVRLGDHRNSSVQPQQFGQALDRWLTEDQTPSQCVVPDPAGEGEVSIASFSLGFQNEGGVLVTGSRRPDFPTEVERLLLRVAANQAGIGLQEARRSSEQKRIAETLEQRVAERTRQLTAVNDNLRRSEAYLADAQRLSHTGSFGWRPSTGDLIWSEETFRIFEYERTTKPTVELILQRVHPADVSLVQQTIERASQDGKNFEQKHRLLMPDGSVKYLHIVARALNDESQGVEFVGAVMDVTAEKQVEQTLREREAYLEEAQRLTHTGSGAWQVLGGKALYLSEEWYRIYGFDPKQGLSVWSDRMQRMHPEDQAKVQERKDRAIREKSDYDVEHRILLPDGTLKYTHTVGHPVLNTSGEVEQFVCTMMDITERKLAEDALRRSESYLAQAQRLTQSGSWAWNVRTGARFWSQETFRIFGYGPEEVKPTWSDLLGRVHPEDRPAIVQKARTEIMLKEDSEFEWRIVLPDGKIKHLHSIAHPVLDESGEIIEIVGTLMDVTERKRAEEGRERLRQAQAELAHINRVTTMGELTASLAHEVNQPIAAAVTDANTCLRWLTRDQPDLEEGRQAASRMVKDATRAADIISRIRLLFKKGTPQRVSIGINEVIREMIALLRGEATRYSISLSTDLAESLPRVMGDRVQLQQVLMNLMINGIEAMSNVDGTRELNICSQRAEDGQLVISITDTGVGLPAQKGDQIFSAFFTTKPQGTGMGLRISRSIVESHGGRLWATDNSPHGASFHLTLPIYTDAGE